MGRRGERGSRRERGSGGPKTAEKGYTRFFINLGKKDGINPKVFMGFINRVSGGARIDLGRIDLMQNFSFFEVPEPQTQTVLRVLQGTDFDGRRVNVEVTDNTEAAPAKGGSRGGRDFGGDRSSRGGRRNDFKSVRSQAGKPVGSGFEKRKTKPSREERGYTAARGPKGAQEWAKYFEGQVESQPFYEQFSKKGKRK